ncbi:MAG: glucose-6-phosphate isomerase [Anaerolineales bacterium]
MMLQEAAHLGVYQSVVERALADLTAREIVPRIWQHDYTVWKPSPAEITHRLGWLTIAERMTEHLPAIQALVAAAVDEGYTDVLWLGMGGSSLAPDVFHHIFEEREEREAGLRLRVLDSTDPGAVRAAAERLDLPHTLFVVATKSGGTVETMSLFKYFYHLMAEMLSDDIEETEVLDEVVGARFVAITDEGSKLDSLGQALGFRHIFRNDPNIGGRFSVLSHFGMVAAALLGVDVEEMLARAREMAEACGPETAPAENPGAWLGAVLGALAKAGRDKLTFITSPALANFGDWIEQLIAESTGKSGAGILPVVGAPLGEPEIYGNDRLFVYLRLDGDAPYDAAIPDLVNAGHPVVRVDLRDLYDLGKQFFLWEFATAVAGERLAIHPFNQPNVEAAKRSAREMIAAYIEKGALPEVETAPLDPEALEAFLAQAEAGDYVAIQAYVQPRPEVDAALRQLQAALRARTRLAVTTAYGPRYLHSTGQLHKGDAGRGLFVQFVSHHPELEAPIPDSLDDATSSITFGMLKLAQALGDYQALVEAGRRVIRFDVGTEVVAGIKEVVG